MMGTESTFPTAAKVGILNILLTLLIYNAQKSSATKARLNGNYGMSCSAAHHNI